MGGWWAEVPVVTGSREVTTDCGTLAFGDSADRRRSIVIGKLHTKQTGQIVPVLKKIVCAVDYVATYQDLHARDLHSSK
jgi:hypothetical protein